jgi:ADP-heptose:LPS heptosyltransferase
MPNTKCTIIISPYSRPMRNGKANAKNYPWWKEVISKLREKGCYVIQVGVVGEVAFDVDEVVNNSKLKVLEKMIEDCDVWCSVDNFFQHLAHLQRKPGVVIFGRSNPDIFGHPENKNLVKDKANLREKQFDIWETVEASDDVFVSPDVVVEALIGSNTK